MCTLEQQAKKELKLSWQETRLLVTQRARFFVNYGMPLSYCLLLSFTTIIIVVVVRRRHEENGKQGKPSTEEKNKNNEAISDKCLCVPLMVET